MLRRRAPRPVRQPEFLGIRIARIALLIVFGLIESVLMTGIHSGVGRDFRWTAAIIVIVVFAIIERKLRRR